MELSGDDDVAINSLQKYAPTRTARYCCEYLKEHGGDGRTVVTGVRWAESVKRSKRKMYEACFKSSRTFYLNTIIDWSDADVWEYIKENNMPYCQLYEEGFKRIGCVGCPNTGKKRIKDFERWPFFKKMYLRAFEKCVESRKQKGLVNTSNYADWDSAQAMFDWWMSDTHVKDNDDQGCFNFE